MLALSLLFAASIMQVVCAAFLLKTSQEPEPMVLHRCLECGSVSEATHQEVL